MKLPALWILSASAAGVAIAGRWPGAPRLRAWTRGRNSGGRDSGCWIFIRRHCVAVSWALALALWVAIGGVAVSVERVAIPANDIARLVTAGGVNPGVALRWRRRWREDPLTLPWGERFEIDLEQVGTKGAALGTNAGLRVNYYPGGWLRSRQRDRRREIASRCW